MRFWEEGIAFEVAGVGGVDCVVCNDQRWLWKGEGYLKSEKLLEIWPLYRY
jgi:hypothetical protein